ncbi:Nif-specific regulatory protein [Rhodoblastus acidophilus]|uniref:Nif-specific regulatory protein n=1 Tax=Rhodoblastus acidophilus TaxID=1074 RepID=A0A212S644_RHOAC|nr:sigma 54-interacting transcriptional regulator [Rhodoblastus acidophilus]AVI02160.1 nitrogenase (iron-iron)-specific transcriptional regulator [Rhodoblastus acidophilus]PPQ37461.1 sigma-54-dependent Fis family transcriptional regulator [Rhodoblastus acidophilus]RAI18822.1 sigma-54-dependent Fis family transcriptional regulator [Rhodoblastus acidophilus]SNB80699.1 Nif-specific regulatory protein [Rhodoblastus acidophilus]
MRLEDHDAADIDITNFVDEFSHCFTGECRVGVLQTLSQISRIITASDDLAGSLPLILAVMRQQLKMKRGLLTLYDRASETIFVHDSFGLSDEEKARGAVLPGEGVIDKVIATGKTLIARSRRGARAVFDKEKKSRAETAFICIPIIHAQKVLGALAAERGYMNPRLRAQDVEILTMIAAMIAPAAELYLLETLEKTRLEQENRRLRNTLGQRFRPDNMIGGSKSMQDVYDLVEKVAATKATVLILGESGVGKELVANAIHFNSAASDGPFIKSNCAALPESLAESELFGHERGAFTGALSLRKGSFELADGGTIFLDEVGELSLSIQAKLLRILQERTFERVGGSRSIKIDVRIIAATNRNLAEMVEKGLFREDLYYRLNVFPITVPPLRERGSDVITLADHFVTTFAAENNKPVKRISTPALNMLMAYHWPGNVRELENIMERAVILCEDEVIHAYALPPSLQTSKESGTSFGVSLESKLHSVEYEMIVEALKNSSGHIGDAARELGLTRRMLGKRLERYGLNYKTFRAAGASGDDLG